MQIPTNPFYDIDENAVVRLISTNEVVQEYINHKGRRAVKIRGRSHKKASCPLDRLMLNTFRPLPRQENPDWWSIKFVDGDRNHISIDNLKWDNSWYDPSVLPRAIIGFDEWVPVYGRPQLELLVTPNTVLIRNAETGMQLYCRDHGNGYDIITDPMNGKAIGLHRLVALTFLLHPVDTDHLTVNHKDSDTKNNLPKNLEWATYSANNFHAFAEGPRGETVKKICLMNLDTGIETTVSGYNEAARFIGVAPGSIHSVMDRRPREGRPYKGYVLKYADDSRSWDELANSPPREKRYVLGKIACKNYRTGVVKIHESVQDAVAEEFVNAHAIYRLLSLKDLVPWRWKCFQEVKDDKPLKWPDYPKEILEVYEQVHASNKPVKVTDGFGNTKYYPSGTHWCEEDRANRCDPAVFSRLLKTTDRWRDWVFEVVDLSKYMHS